MSLRLRVADLATALTYQSETLDGGYQPHCVLCDRPVGAGCAPECKARVLLAVSDLLKAAEPVASILLAERCIDAGCERYINVDVPHSEGLQCDVRPFVESMTEGGLV